jgi:glycine cleavage system regulatory protein
MPTLILTVIGPDRPGLVRALAQAVANQGGSWLESRMARLAGQFAGIVRIEAPDTILDELRHLEQLGLRVTAERAEPAARPTGERLVLEVTGNDRPGIVRDVTRVLAENAINIEELTTNVEAASFTGGTLFRAVALLRAPSHAAIEAVQSGLEELGNELMVDVRPAPEEAG